MQYKSTINLAHDEEQLIFCDLSHLVLVQLQACLDYFVFTHLLLDLQFHGQVIEESFLLPPFDITISIFVVLVHQLHNSSSDFLVAIAHSTVKYLDIITSIISLLNI